MILPEKKYMALIVIACLITPVSYVVFPYAIEHTAQGKALVGENRFVMLPNDALNQNLMIAYKFNFMVATQLPGSGSAFNMVGNGSPFLFIPLGVALFFLNPLFAQMLAIFAFSALCAIILYNFVLKFFGKSTAEITLILFLFGAGISGIIFGITLAAGINLHAAVSMIFGGLAYMQYTDFPSQATRLYQFVPHLLGILAFLLMHRKKFAFAGVSLGISLLIYPYLGAFYALMMVIFSLMHRIEIKQIAKTALISAIIFVPWILTYLLHPEYAITYASRYLSGMQSPVSLILTFLPLLVFLPFLRKMKNGKFILAWSIIALVFAIINFRYTTALRIPLILSAGIVISSIVRQDTRKILIIALILISIPTLFLFQAYNFGSEVHDSYVYFSENDLNALKFLETQPAGRLMSSPEIGSIAPLYSGKTVLLSFDGLTALPDYAARKAAAESFYSGKSDSVIGMYNISYIFLGDNERKANASIDAYTNLELIYNNGTQVYKIKA